MLYKQNIRVLDKIYSGSSYSSVDLEFSVNESIIQCVQKKEEEIHQFVCKESAKGVSVVYDEAMEKMEK